MQQLSYQPKDELEREIFYELDKLKQKIIANGYTFPEDEMEVLNQT